METYKIYPCEPIVCNGPLADPFGIAIQESDVRYISWLTHGGVPDVTSSNPNIQIVDNQPVWVPYVPTYSYEMSISKNLIVGDSGDHADLVVKSNDPNLTTVDVSINGTTVPIAMRMGIGEMELTSSLPRGIISIDGLGVLSAYSFNLYVV